MEEIACHFTFLTKSKVKYNFGLSPDFSVQLTVSYRLSQNQCVYLNYLPMYRRQEISIQQHLVTVQIKLV